MYANPFHIFFFFILVTYDNHIVFRLQNDRKSEILYQMTDIHELTVLLIWQPQKFYINLAKFIFLETRVYKNKFLRNYFFFFRFLKIFSIKHLRIVCCRWSLALCLHAGNRDIGF